MKELFYFKKMTTQAEIAEFWHKKRGYEEADIFPDLAETGEELADIMAWFRSAAYYETIMNLHHDFPANSKGLQFAFIYSAQEAYLGFLMYKIYTEEDGKCFILDFCIDTPYRNRQIGARVFQALEASLRTTEGAKYFELNTSNAGNERFWKRQGFVAAETNEYGDIVYVKSDA